MGGLRFLWLLCLLIVAPILGMGPAMSATSTSSPTVVVLQVDGVISPATSDFISRGLDTAIESGASLAIIQMDTPGGLDSSMRTIVRRILASPIPVATYVGPHGARAASAGTFILYASHFAAMSPASNLGAATPVAVGGGDLPGRDPGDATDDKDTASTKPSRSSMEAKATNDAAAYLRSLAQLRGRNAEFAEAAVREARSLSAEEAHEAGVIDIIASSIPELLIALDGREVTLGSGQQLSLHTANAQVQTVEADWRTRMLGVIANPQVALILMMIGVYGLFFELMNPGATLPGVAGLICLVLGLYAFQMLPINWAGAGLLVLGLVLIIAEAFFPSFGALGVGGIVAFILGGLFLMDTDAPDFQLSVPFLGGVAIAGLGMTLGIAYVATRAHRARIVSGSEEMIGRSGWVRAVTDGIIYAEVRGERWRVISEDALSVGDPIVVREVDGLTLKVTRSPTIEKGEHHAVGH